MGMRSLPRFDEQLDAISDWSISARERLQPALQPIRQYLRDHMPRALTSATVVDQPWRFVVAVLCVLFPALSLAIIAPGLPVTTPGVVLLVAVAFSAYLADWVGGISALIITLVMLDLLFVGNRSSASLPSGGDETSGFILIFVSGVALVWLIQLIKSESQVDRQAAVAARAAATALTSIEAAAAAHATGSIADRNALHDSLLRAMVGVNRAHVGLLFLFDENDQILPRVASYGIGLPPGPLDTESDPAVLFARQIASERRSRFVTDIAADVRFRKSFLVANNVHAAIGIPLVSGDGQVLGVALIGLLVLHKFSPTERARLEALADRSAAVIQAALGIDERETALITAQEANHWLESIILAMPEAVVLVAPDNGRVIAENQAAIDLLGSQLVEQAGDRLVDRLLLPDGGSPDPESLPIEIAKRSGEIVTGVELIVRKPDGAEVPVLVSAAPVLDANGPVVAIVAVFRDIAALKEASRLKDEFVSVVSHELRSPLTPIRGFVQLVAKELTREGGHDSHVRRLNSIAGHVDRMTRLVDDLLDVSRLKSGSLEIRPGPADLVELCKQVARDRGAANSSHRIVMESKIPSVFGSWDADRLYQIIDNLVGNAIKYSPANGRVTITVAEDSGTGDALVTVSDEGRGILAEDRERIFAAFYRTREAETSQIAGLGLGLYICHELVAAHGGAIEVGDAPSGGAAFTVRLPRISQAQAA